MESTFNIDQATKFSALSPILLRGKAVRKGNRVLDAPNFQGLDLEMSLAERSALECVTRLCVSTL